MTNDKEKTFLIYAKESLHNYLSCCSGKDFFDAANKWIMQHKIPAGWHIVIAEHDGKFIEGRRVNYKEFVVGVSCNETANV